MRPRIAKVLEQLLAQLGGQLLPKLPPGFEQGMLGTQLLLLGAVQEEFERAAARRVEENRAMREIFVQAAALSLEDDLDVRLAEAASREDHDLRISALDVANDELRALLIELHAAVESRDDEPARALDEAIWTELAHSTTRRQLPTAPL